MLPLMRAREQTSSVTELFCVYVIQTRTNSRSFDLIQFWDMKSGMNMIMFEPNVHGTRA